MLGGLFYGIFLYKAQVSIPRVLSAKLLINMIVNALLGTIWYSMLYGKGFYALIVPRLTANLIKIPVETIVLSIFLPVLIAVMRRAKVRI